MFRPLDDNANVFSVIGWIRPSSRIALHRNFNELRSALSDVHLQQIDAPAPYMFCALQFACSTLNVRFAL